MTRGDFKENKQANCPGKVDKGGGQIIVSRDTSPPFYSHPFYLSTRVSVRVRVRVGVRVGVWVRDIFCVEMKLFEGIVF